MVPKLDLRAIHVSGVFIELEVLVAQPVAPQMSLL